MASFFVSLTSTIFTMMISFENDINNCLRVLQNGGIILYPTDTIWGIGCDATNAAAVEKIIQLKNRPAQKSFVVLVASASEIMEHVAELDLRVFDHLHQTTKPTTVIYKNAIGLANNVIAKNGSVAIRICNDEFCKQLIKNFGKPIVSTSANIGGETAPANFKKISEAIISQVDYVVQHRQNENGSANPSSIIEWNNGVVKLIRQ